MLAAHGCNTNNKYPVTIKIQPYHCGIMLVQPVTRAFIWMSLHLSLHVASGPNRNITEHIR